MHSDQHFILTEWSVNATKLTQRAKNIVPD